MRLKIRGIATRTVGPVGITVAAVSTVLLAGLASWAGAAMANNETAQPTVTSPQVAATSIAATTSPAPTTAAPAATTSARPAKAAAPAVVAPVVRQRTSSVRTPVNTAPRAPAPTRARVPVPICTPDPNYYVLKEQTRIAREAQMFNLNTQLNMAVNSGNLDEAAVIQNDMIALQQQWDREDQMNPPPRLLGLGTEVGRMPPHVRKRPGSWHEVGRMPPRGRERPSAAWRIDTPPSQPATPSNRP